MALVEWKPSYSVGVPVFDRQHARLFELMNQLHEAMSKGQAKEQLGRIVDALSTYTKIHFAEEELALQRANYKDLAAHKILPRKLEAKVDGFGNEIKQGTVGLSIQVMDFLNDWLVNHIMKIDRDYQPLLAQSQAAVQ